MIPDDKFRREILAIFLTIIITVLSLPLSVLLLPVYSFRFVVAYLAKVFRKDLGEMLTPRSSLFAVEFPGMFETKSRGTIFIMHTFNGRINLETFRKCILKNVVNLRCSSENKLEYPELQQTMTSWLGYFFWKWDKNFWIENHIKLYDGPGKVDLVSDEDILEIMKDLTIKPFTIGQSPWEFWLWNNARLKRDPEQKEKTIILLRTHHSLGDGYALLKLVLEDMIGSKLVTSVVQPKLSRKSNKPNSLLKILWDSLLFIVKAPYQFISTSIHSYDCNDWHIPESKLSGRINFAMTEPIPVELIKEIKNMYGTSFHTIIQSAFTGGLRNFMIEQRVKLPHALHCIIPLPVPGHPRKLRNHWSIVMVPLPVGIEDPRVRVQFVDTASRKLQKSTLPGSNFYIGALYGALPAWIMRKVVGNVITTCLMSNFPTSFRHINFLGCEGDDTMFGSSLTVGNIGIAMYSLSYNDNIRLSVGIDEGLLPNPKLAKRFIQKVEEELHILRRQEIF